jgi:hypothetical protein
VTSKRQIAHQHNREREREGPAHLAPVLCRRSALLCSAAAVIPSPRRRCTPPRVDQSCAPSPRPRPLFPDPPLHIPPPPRRLRLLLSRTFQNPPSLLRWPSSRPPPTTPSRAPRSRTPARARCGIWRTSSPSSTPWPRSSSRPPSPPPSGPGCRPPRPRTGTTPPTPGSRPPRRRPTGASSGSPSDAAPG